MWDMHCIGVQGGLTSFLGLDTPIALLAITIPLKILAKFQRICIVDMHSIPLRTEDRADRIRLSKFEMPNQRRQIKETKCFFSAVLLPRFKGYTPPLFIARTFMRLYAELREGMIRG